MKKFFAMCCFAIIIFLTGCSNEPSVEVSIAKVQAIEDSASVTHDGIISLSDAEPIYSKVSGNVVSMYFERGGEEVRQNQPLFEVGNQQDELELMQTRTSLVEAMTALPKELAEKNPNVAERQNQIAELQARVKQMEEDSAVGMIYSPKTGTIGLKHALPGESVINDKTVLALVGSENPAVVKLDIAPEERQVLTASDKLKVSLKFIDGTIYQREGKINFGDTQTEAVFDNPDGLLMLGYAIQIQIDDVKVPKALLVPENAVFQRGEEDFVFVVASDKTAVEKKISLGGKLGDKIIVVDGLKADDSVVVEGLANLREGTPLSVMNDK